MAATSGVGDGGKDNIMSNPASHKNSSDAPLKGVKSTRYDSPTPDDSHRFCGTSSCTPPRLPRSRHCSVSVTDSDFSAESLFDEINSGRSVLHSKPSTDIAVLMSNLSRKTLRGEFESEDSFDHQNAEASSNVRRIRPCLENGLILQAPSYPLLNASSSYSSSRAPNIFPDELEDDDMPVLRSPVRLRMRPSRVGGPPQNDPRVPIAGGREFGSRYFVPIQSDDDDSDEEQLNQGTD